MTDWKALLRDAPSLRVLYVIGQAEAPGDPFGEISLRTWADGSARMEQRRGPLFRSWTGRVTPSVIRRLRDGLVDVGFPNPPDVTLLPGGTRKIYVRAERRAAQVELPLYELPGFWAGMFAMLDSVTTALGGPDVSSAPPEPGIAPGKANGADPELRFRWYEHGEIWQGVARGLGVGRSWVEPLKGLPRASEVASGLDLRGMPVGALEADGADLAGADLSGADLSPTRLAGARLAGARLAGADLSWARLGGADLSNADLRGALLTDADLRGADLSGADLSGADLRDADLAGAKMEGARLEGAIRGTS